MVYQASQQQVQNLQVARAVGAGFFWISGAKEEGLELPPHLLRCSGVSAH